jgi:hypothetical protein
MTFRPTRIATALALASALAGAAQAQGGSLHLGPRLSYQFDLEKIGLGAQFSAPIAHHLEFYSSFDYFFVSNGSFWQLNADLKYRMPEESVGWLYLGTGLGIARSGSGSAHDTQAGLNLFAGVESRSGRVHPFGEFRVLAKSHTTAQVAVGLNFTLNSR